VHCRCGFIDVKYGGTHIAGKPGLRRTSHIEYDQAVSFQVQPAQTPLFCSPLESVTASSQFCLLCGLYAGFQIHGLTA
jgi:hypothetical protein